jgi:hypothetical protein
MRSVKLHGGLSAVGTLVNRPIFGNRELPDIRRPEVSVGVAGKHNARGELAFAVQFFGQTLSAHVEQPLRTKGGSPVLHGPGDPFPCSFRRTATSSRWIGTSSGAETPSRMRLPRGHSTTSTTMSRPMKIRSPSLLLKTSMALTPLPAASAPELTATSCFYRAGDTRCRTAVGNLQPVLDSMYARRLHR